MKSTSPYPVLDKDSIEKNMAAVSSCMVLFMLALKLVSMISISFTKVLVCQNHIIFSVFQQQNEIYNSMKALISWLKGTSIARLCHIGHGFFLSFLWYRWTQKEKYAVKW